jgi:predicted transcriptional regulator
MSDMRFEKFVKAQKPEMNPTAFIEEYQQSLKIFESDPAYHQNLQILIALGNQTRWAIYNLLKIQPMCTCALATIFTMKENTMSHHLKILESAKILQAKKQGFFTIYHVLPIQIQI